MRDYKPGTNGLDAFEACLECGACSEEKFLESDEFNDFKTEQIFGFIFAIGVTIGIIITCWYQMKFTMDIWDCLGCSQPKSEDVSSTGSVVTSPEPVQPVVQPSTTVIINNNNNSGFQQPQFQPQQQVSYKHSKKN